ncbi:PREDICTED: suppressor of fused homolog isoform X1 [Nicrophorus vespilloides]|uniref:Suppressor of fused homolog isoform X1 n=1 Tax=Nicrophorus vespilloides TaxID=110193 RepID=A0ABM1MC56_NICVS|nr:PREDICTED: suppressor of fused homolog isoform X1 [Nicrophorus vespilloides]
MDEAGALPQGPPINMLPPTPPGLEALYTLCRKIYPDQVNPLQVTALLKYWLGGPDPLDYISMYAHPGNAHENIPPHWHYISFGLSDLHGDGRVHDVTGPEGLSGFGFELTFRLKREPGETSPPTWPANLMQSLAKYVFHSGNTLCTGDHVSWHCALDNSESRIQHMLMTSDIQLSSAQTPFGNVDFIQIVGVCADELRAAQQWNGSGVLNMLSNLPASGGPWHVTDMRRGESIFEYDPSAHEELERGFETEGSNLSGVSARCSWTDHEARDRKFVDGVSRLTDEETEQIKNTLQKGLQGADGFNKLDDVRESSGMLESAELLHVRKLDGIHLVFNLEAGSLLPLAIRGRVKHGRHFTFKSVLGETAITLVANSVTGTLVDMEHPFVAQGSWLQVLIPDDLAQDMAVTFQVLGSPEALSLPKTFSWPERKLSITIVADKI